MLNQANHQSPFNQSIYSKSKLFFNKYCINYYKLKFMLYNKWTMKLIAKFKSKKK